MQPVFEIQTKRKVNKMLDLNDNKYLIAFESDGFIEILEIFNDNIIKVVKTFQL